ncbi:hypothetical protein G3I44_04175 [Halogeometricum borinquense]|uniref:Uncharacterized protein n=1 Tax=Halogeometricum borinquense TaxID=60847 RepID=A0A6C0UED6_9EURY|nr:hypothetical protein [Halogeometricum borinquense]QIB73550.1 hypothetical protein G3I44_04175 [Halogeometricum borinquense]
MGTHYASHTHARLGIVTRLTQSRAKSASANLARERDARHCGRAPTRFAWVDASAGARSPTDAAACAVTGACVLVRAGTDAGRRADSRPRTLARADDRLWPRATERG